MTKRCSHGIANTVCCQTSLSDVQLCTLIFLVYHCVNILMFSILAAAIERGLNIFLRSKATASSFACYQALPCEHSAYTVIFRRVSPPRLRLELQHSAFFFTFCTFDPDGRNCITIRRVYLHYLLLLGDDFFSRLLNAMQSLSWCLSCRLFLSPLVDSVSTVTSRIRRGSNNGYQHREK